MHRCGKCDTLKPARAFTYSMTRAGDGLAAWCKACSAKIKKHQYQTDRRARARRLQINTAWRARNPEKVRAANKVWAEANRDQRAAYMRAWKQKNRERVNAAARAAYAINRSTAARAAQL